MCGGGGPARRVRGAGGGRGGGGGGGGRVEGARGRGVAPRALAAAPPRARQVTTTLHFLFY